MTRSRRVRAGNPKLAIGLVRMSTGKQAASPARQGAAMDRWAKAHGVTIVAVFFDMALSGATPVYEREGLVAAIAALTSSGAGVLLASDRSRIGRDTGVMGTVEASVRASGAVVRTADGASDGADDDEGAFVRRSVDDMISVLERMKIRSRTRSALAVKKARGERVGEVSFGFRLAADGVHVEPDAGEQATIEAIRALRAERLSVRAIAAQLASRGMVGRTGRPLSHTQVHRIIAA